MYSLLPLVLFLVLPPPLFSSPSGPPDSKTDSGNELSRLIGISTRLAELNETLRNELAGSRKNSTELSGLLAASKTEAEELRTELERLRQTSTELLSSAEISNRESDELKAALMKAETSLASLELSFGAYRTAAEARITRLERRGRFTALGFIVSAVLALSGWAAFGISNTL
jgi:predicted RNase H-like nuclease (RuvC/YqgF family)